MNTMKTRKQNRAKAQAAQNKLALGLVVIAVIVGVIAYVNRPAAPPTPSVAAGCVQGSVDNVITLPSGLKYADTLVCQGREAKSGDMLSMNYTGMLSNGTVFDSSSRGGRPLQFQLGVGQVIQGWDQGIVGMKVGSKRRLIIPPALGYGASGQGPIPPNATLIFDVELVSIP